MKRKQDIKYREFEVKYIFPEYLIPLLEYGDTEGVTLHEISLVKAIKNDLHKEGYMYALDYSCHAFKSDSPCIPVDLPVICIELTVTYFDPEQN